MKKQALVVALSIVGVGAWFAPGCSVTTVNNGGDSGLGDGSGSSSGSSSGTSSSSGSSSGGSDSGDAGCTGTIIQTGDMACDTCIDQTLMADRCNCAAAGNPGDGGNSDCENYIGCVDDMTNNMVDEATARMACAMPTDGGTPPSQAAVTTGNMVLDDICGTGMGQCGTACATVCGGTPADGGGD